jgi:hypothetical protein
MLLFKKWLENVFFFASALHISLLLDHQEIKRIFNKLDKMFFFTTYVWKMGFIDPIVNETFFFLV